MKLKELLSEKKLSIFYQIAKYCKLYIILYFSRIGMYFNKYFRGLIISSNNNFYGIPIFHRYPNSLIKFGKENTLISLKYSFVNPAGINRKCIFSTMSNRAEIVIGDRSGFSGTVVSSMKSIRIGNNVNCGANTTIYDHDFHMKDGTAAKYDTAMAVTIQDNVWLGLNVIVLKGVTIGKGAVIGAGSIVTKSIPQYSIATGIPAKVINKITR